MVNIKIKKNELLTVPVTMSFEKEFVIEDDMNFLVNSINVYSCMESDSLGKVFNKQVGFDIRIINDKKVIIPIDLSDSYVLFAEKLIKGTVVEIKAEDCIDKTICDGNFNFVIREDSEG